MESTVRVTSRASSAGPDWWLDFLSLTEEEAVRKASATYMYNKTICDRKVLEFQDEHPEIDVTIREYQLTTGLVTLRSPLS